MKSNCAVLALSRLLFRFGILGMIVCWCSLSTDAGSVNIQFDATDTLPGATYGAAAVDGSGGMGNSGALKLTTANGQAGFLVLDELDAGQAVATFVATFDLRIGSDTSSVLHGDGLSFNFGPDIPDDVFALPEEGIGSGLRISFDSFNNAGPVYQEAPAIEVTYNNEIIATKLVNYLSTGSGYVPVKIELHPEGTLDLFYGTNTVFTNLLCYAPIAGRFSLGANAGAERFLGDPIDMHWVDNLSINTTTAQTISFQAANPRGSSVAPDAVIEIQLRDGSRQVNTGSVQLKLDGTLANSRLVNKANGVTSITYDPPGLMTAGSSHSVELSYADDGAPAKTTSVTYSFSVYPYITLPASYAVSPGGVNTGSPGFKVRTHQVSVDAGTSVQRAELQFANNLTNPLDGSLLPNIADLSGADVNGAFDVTSPIDFSTFPDPQGFFALDTPPPGVTGTDQYALEIMTYLNLTAGPHTFGADAVRNYNTTAPGSYRQSGFRLTTGNNPKDLFAPEVASFDPNRPEGEARFSFVVQQAGIYPFRLLWFSGVGMSSLEWYEVTPQGNRVLIGDTASSGIAAYKDATVTHPYVQYTTTPKPNETSVAANTPIRVMVVDGSAVVVTNTIQLRLNNQVVSPSVASDATTAGLTKIDFQPAGGLPSGSTNSVRVTFNDSSGAAYDEQWSFVVAGNLAIPGLYAVEAEHFAANVPYIDPGDVNSHTWELTTNSAGFSGEGAMVAEPNVNFNANVDTTVSPRLDYNMNFTIAGTYFVWVRALADSAPGPSQSDSVNVGIDGVLPASQASAKISGFPPGGFVWSRTTVAGTPATIVVPSTGPHVVNVWMREDGFIFDKLLFTTNNAYVPTGFGPVETTTVTRPELSYTVNGKELNVSWTGGGVLESAAEVTGPYLPAVEGSVSPVSISININVSRRFFRVVR